jgi:Ca-activated chloride channel family protein
VRDLEDRFAVVGDNKLADRIVETSIEFGVLSRFTAFVAVDRSQVVASTDPISVIQPVEQPAGWVQPPALMKAGAPPAPAAAPMTLAADTYAEMELGPPPSTPAGQAPPSAGARYRAITRRQKEPEPVLDRYAMRRDRLTAQVRDAVTRHEPDRVRRLLQQLRILRDDLVSINVGGGALDDLQTLIDALVEWVDAPSDAAASLVMVAIDALDPLTATAEPRDRSRFWR